MDYEKAYKDLIAKVKKAHLYAQTDSTKAVLEDILPELRESEYERIRLKIHAYLFNTLHNTQQLTPSTNELERWLAYLEKQKVLIDEYEDRLDKCACDSFNKGFNAGINRKEQKSLPSFDDLTPDEKMNHPLYLEGFDTGREVGRVEAEQKPVELPKSEDYGIDGLYAAVDILQKTLGKVDGYQTDDGILEHKCAISAVKELYEQKPAEWCEDYREEDIQTRFAFYTYKDEDGVLYLSNVFVEETSRNHGFGTKILIAAEKVAETIGATTISLKVKQDSPANAWYRKNGYGYVAFEDGYDWLEKNLEYMKPNKQEWSEEDDMLMDELESYILYDKEFNDEQKSWRIKRLKSLRPQPHWKPSEEQMKGLCEGILKADKGSDAENSMVSLYNNLKKLM